MLNWNDPRLARLEQGHRAAWVWDAQQRRILWATDEGARVWGVDDAFLLVDRPFGASDPAAQDLSLAADALDHIEGIETEIRLNQGGRIRSVNVMARRFARGPNGDFILFTLRTKRAESANPESARPNPIADLLGSFPLGLALFSPQGRGLYTNPAFERIFGPASQISFADLMSSRKGGERLVRSILSAGSIRVTPTLVREGTRMTIEIDAALIRDPVAQTSAILLQAQDISGRRGRERQLSERFEMLRTLLSASVDGWLLLDAQLRVRLLGGTLFADLGEETVQAIGLDWQDAFERLQLARGAKIEAAMRAHEMTEVTITVDPPRQMTIIPKWSEDGDFLGQQLIIASRRASDAANAAGEAAPLAFDLGFVPLLAHDNFEIVFANERAAKLFGAASPQALIGRPFLGLFRDDERRASRHYDDLFVGNREVRTAGLKARNLQGEALAVDAEFRYTAHEGKQVILASFQDVTRFANAASPSEPASRMDWIEAAPVPLLLIDTQGRISRANHQAAGLLKLAPSEIAGRKFDELIDKADRTAYEIRRAAATSMREGQTAQMQVILKLRADHQVSALISLRAAPPSMDSGLIVSIVDLQSHRAREAELQRVIDQAGDLNRQKTEFLSAISHEMRTPLNAIIGFSEFMKEGQLGPIGNEKYAGYIDDIHMSGQHLLSLVNDLLDMSKIEAGRYELDFTVVDVAAVIDQALRIIRPQADKKAVRLVKSVNPVPNVIADQRSLRQILLNLLSNAVKFTPGTGSVTVKTSHDPITGVVIEVSDTGIGMNKDELAQALEPYRQVHHTHANDETGTGLGLPLAKALTEANHALFVIESVPDRGTSARILFPAAQVADEIAGEV